MSALQRDATYDLFSSYFTWILSLTPSESPSGTPLRITTDPFTAEKMRPSYSVDGKEEVLFGSVM